MSIHRRHMMTLQGGLLPSAYQQVHNMYATGGAYIDTGLCLNVGFDEVSMLFNWNEVYKVDKYLYGIGYRNIGYLNIGCVFRNQFIYGLSFTLPNIYSWGSEALITGLYFTTPKKFFISHTKSFFKVIDLDTGIEYSILQKAITVETNTLKIYTEKNNTTPSVDEFSMFWQGEMVRHFIPCYRKSDNVVGMYDVVNGVFYTNAAGTGSFNYDII